MLQAILAPNTNADFRNQKQVTIVWNCPSYRYDYTVEQPRSIRTLRADGQTVSPSYVCSIWIDKATYRVLRIEIAANLFLATSSSTLPNRRPDYDFVGDRRSERACCPAQADSLSVPGGTPDCTKNHTEFHNYKKYGVDSNITFEGAADK